ncbi:hypothetical protein Tdes44962_MAKER02102 [Teratosphaeria destructans]|uniref:Uncharacterized protein n=1 Tax=Teratosphaeria destructans TaxID=418781 RepID=A0A9W7SVD6_9PEZI|nr:hypothetical protein Tdes44962_MAKER02102 [Teratosphaeria destructans]
MPHHDLLPLLRPRRRQQNLHIKFSPSLLDNAEWRCSEGLLRTLGAERFVQDVGGFLEAVGRQGVAVGSNEVDLDAPLAHGDLIDFGRVRRDVLGRDELDCALDLRRGDVVSFAVADADASHGRAVVGVGEDGSVA